MALAPFRFGDKDFDVCPIALGTIPLARLPRAEAVDLILYALSQGMNFIDTARAYGPAEEYVGEALRKWREGAGDGSGAGSGDGSGANSANVVVATKSMARRAEELRSELATSLENLGRPKVDLFFLHQVDTFANLSALLADDGALAGLLAAREEGLVDKIGLSGHFTPVLMKALDELPLDYLLGRFNLTMTEDECALIGKARGLGVSLASMKVFEGGFVTRHTDLALRYALHGPDVDLVMIGCESKKQIDENLQAWRQSLPLSEDEMAHVLASAETLRAETFCSYCGYCTDGCPKDLPISHIFNLEAKLNVFGAEFGFAGSPGAELYLSGFDSAIEACNDCGLCEERCPNRLPIRKLLKERKAQFAKCLEDGKIGDGKS